MVIVLLMLVSEYFVIELLFILWVLINVEDFLDISEIYNVIVVLFFVLICNGQVLEIVSGSSVVKVWNVIEVYVVKVGVLVLNGVVIVIDGYDGEVVIEEDLEKKKEEFFKCLGDFVKVVFVMFFMKGIFSEFKCGFFWQLVVILWENVVKYGFFNILVDDEVCQGFKEFVDWLIYFQFWVDGELVGGFDIVCFFFVVCFFCYMGYVD